MTTAVGTRAAESAVARRIAELESALGDPWDPANPYGHGAVLEADDRGELPAEAERLLHALGLCAEFVPQRLGGRFDRADVLARMLRPVFRRDPSLGVGFGAGSFLAAVSVWAAGTEEQQRRTADLLLAGGRVAVAYRDLAHGNAFLRDEFSLTEEDGTLRLDGAKRVIVNAEQAGALVVFCRTDDRPGSRSHSAVLLERAALPADRVRDLDRFPTVGLRGCTMSGLAFTDCPVPREALLGGWGEGVNLALSSFQLTRSVLPSMVLAGVDTALRTALRFAMERGVHGRPVLRVPQARASLAGSFADLLVCDSLALTSTRAVHLHPEATGVYAAATKYLLPILLSDTVYDLSVLLGSSLYERSGAYGIFQKQVRDLPITSLGHSGTAACQSTVIPRLPVLAEHAWLVEEAPGPGLFRLRDDLPALDTGRLGVAGTADPLLAELADFAAGSTAVAAAGEHREVLETLVRTLAAELHELRAAARSLAGRRRDDLADPRSYALMDRYALLLAAASALGVWRHQRGGPDEFLARPDWVVLALLRICRRLGLGLPGRPAPGAEGQVLEELLRRYAAGGSFDLYDDPTAAVPAG
ncbi:acyl-CoA dehydrogenase family protein [Kitasatospora sp. NPDC094015]|uniref:acyl-CoA dehydrogenase family protein n=1 Tax=Kitasatospora sp. NPDC094015 TaxID=3155205 RepID=UPI00332C09B5